MGKHPANPERTTRPRAVDLVREAYLTAPADLPVTWWHEFTTRAGLRVGDTRFVLGEEYDYDDYDDYYYDYYPTHRGWTWTTYVRDGAEWDEQTTDSSQDEAEVRAALAAWVGQVSKSFSETERGDYK